METPTRNAWIRKFYVSLSEQLIVRAILRGAPRRQLDNSRLEYGPYVVEAVPAGSKNTVLITVLFTKHPALDRDSLMVRSYNPEDNIDDAAHEVCDFIIEHQGG